MRVFLIAIAMMFSGMVYAGEGGEGNNTGCNGQGNPNSPCEPSDRGKGKPSGGGTQVISIDNGYRIQPSSGGGSSSSSSSADNSVTIQSTSYGADLSKHVPDMHVPAPRTSNNAFSCLKGASGGITVSGFGGSLGGFTMDENCDARVTSNQLMDYGMEEHAIQVLCELESMREADKKVAEMRGTAPRCYQSKAKKKVSVVDDPHSYF